MRRLIAIALLAVAVIGVAVLGTGASNGKKSDYRVRAIFDNAVSVIPGEDVKIAGVKVGKIDSLDITRDQKAAVVLALTEPGFQDFRADATCIIRAQSLIGEKFVDCTPTQPRAQGEPEAPSLKKIKDGPGKGEYLLSVDHNSSPVDLDLINNVLRRPYAERLSIIVNELGTGLAGRGKDLQETIRRANPALQQTDKVLKLLAQQNQILANLVSDSDTVIAPLARDRRQVADFIVQSGETAKATAERRVELEAGLQRLPRFLRELRPTMVRLGGLADQATPVLRDLGAVAPDVNRFIEQLGPFSQASIPAFKTLGSAADVGRPALKAFDPIVVDLRRFAANAKPLANNLSALTTSLKQTGGIERLMDYIFYQVAAINGFDGVGHYLRAGLMLNLCSTYAITPGATCQAKMGNVSAASASAGPPSEAGRSPALVATDRALRGLPYDTATSRSAQSDAAKKALPRATPLKLPTITLPGQAPASTSPHGKGSGAADSGALQSSPSADLLDYLLGND